MAVLPILIQGDPVLHRVAAPVETFDEHLATLVQDLYDTMAEAPGVGLAAPQVGVPLRIFVFDWTDDEGVHHRGEAINPELLISPGSPFPPDPEDSSEGCLSFPGERFPLARGNRAVLTATNLRGERYRAEAEGWLARIFQHEYDHLDGILYVDRLLPDYAKTARRIGRKRGWGAPGHTWMPGMDHLDA